MTGGGTPRPDRSLEGTWKNHRHLTSTRGCCTLVVAAPSRRSSSHRTASVSSSHNGSAPDARCAWSASNTRSCIESSTACGAVRPNVNAAASSGAGAISPRRCRSLPSRHTRPLRLRAPDTVRPGRNEAARPRFPVARAPVGRGYVASLPPAFFSWDPASSSGLWPSSSPVLNSFWAWPRERASWGSCEPPKITSTISRMMRVREHRDRTFETFRRSGR